MPAGVRSKTGLGVFGKREKPIDVALEVRLICKAIVMNITFPVFYRHLVSWLILPVVLLAIAPFAAASSVESPCCIKPSPLPSWQCFPKLSDGGLQNWEFIRQEIRYCFSVVFGGPFCWDWVQAGEGLRDGASEFERRIAESYKPLNCEGAQAANERCKDGKDAARRASEKFIEIVHAFLLGLILAAIPLGSTFLTQIGKDERKTPNV